MSQVVHMPAASHVVPARNTKSILVNRVTINSSLRKTYPRSVGLQRIATKHGHDKELVTISRVPLQRLPECFLTQSFNVVRDNTIFAVLPNELGRGIQGQTIGRLGTHTGLPRKKFEQELSIRDSILNVWKLCKKTRDITRRNSRRPRQGQHYISVQALQRFHDKELHKKQFEYHRGGKIRPARPTPVDTLDVIMFQGFNWESQKHNPPWWRFLQTKVQELVELGVTDVWLPPASQSVDKHGYLPGQLYNLDASRYGKGFELRDLIDTLHAHGICAIGDIVINHRTAGKQDLKGHWNVFDGGVTDKRLAWGAWAVVDDGLYDSGGKGKHDTGESYSAAPDLDHTSKQVQDELTDWMNWLRAEVGYDGWRFDYAKGYGAQYCALYCERTNPTFAVGEIWTTMSYTGPIPDANQDKHRQRLCDWVDGTGGHVCAFDFTTKGVLQIAVCGELWRLQDSKGKPPGLIGWWPHRAVTFLDNHDTGSTQRHWSFPDDKVAMGYAYILTHPGIPCIFYDHYFDGKIKVQIKELVEVRKRNGINAESKVVIDIAEDDIYVATINDHLILKLGTRMEMGKLLPDDREWKLAAFGEDYAIWESKKMLPPQIPLHQFIPEPLEGVEYEPTHKVRVTKKMTLETKKRIMEEIPNLIDKDEENKSENE